MSFTITRNISPDVDIPHLILRGLGVGGSEPAPPELGIADPGETITLLDEELSEGGVCGEVVALPGEFSNQITWQVYYNSVPSSASVKIELSLDGLHFADGDESTNVNGEIRTFRSSAKFARACFGVMEDNIGTTVKMVAKEIGFIPL